MGVLLIPIGLITGPWLSCGIVAASLLRSVAPISDFEVTARRRLIATLRAAVLDAADGSAAFRAGLEVVRAVA